ncbi:hypothetical protein TSAR_003477, partial [Trichomalopsis sarcophagae]
MTKEILEPTALIISPTSVLFVLTADKSPKVTPGRCNPTVPLPTALIHLSLLHHHFIFHRLLNITSPASPSPSKALISITWPSQHFSFRDTVTTGSSLQRTV